MPELRTAQSPLHKHPTRPGAQTTTPYSTRAIKVREVRGTTSTVVSLRMVEEEAIESFRSRAAPLHPPRQRIPYPSASRGRAVHSLPTGLPRSASPAPLRCGFRFPLALFGCIGEPRGLVMLSFFIYLHPPLSHAASQATSTLWRNGGNTGCIHYSLCLTARSNLAVLLCQSHIDGQMFGRICVKRRRRAALRSSSFGVTIFF